MKIGEPYTQEIVVVPIHEVDEEDMRLLRIWGKEEMYLVEWAAYDDLFTFSISLRNAVQKIRAGGIVDRVVFIEGNG